MEVINSFVVAKEATETRNTDNFMTLRNMKRLPVFRDISIETGHPEHAVNNVTEQLEDMGFEITSGGSSISNDAIAEGIKTYREDIEAVRYEKEYSKNSKKYKEYSLYGLITSIMFIASIYLSWKLIIPASLSVLVTLILWNLSKPRTKKDKIWVKVNGKIYAGTKSRQTRDSGKQNAGITRSASTTYVHSEITFYLAGDSEIDVKRIREDINQVSKHIQKI